MKALKVILILLVVGIIILYFMPSDLLGDKVTENVIEEVVGNESEDLEEVVEEIEKDVVEETLQAEVENIDAQNHLAFKGIPIAGSMELFSKRLKEKGFSSIGKEGKTYFFRGDFTGRESTIAVASTEKGKVYSVTVFFTPSKEWNTLVKTYLYYKDIYTQKYGQPSYQKQYNPESKYGNTSAMSVVDDGTLTWKSRWKDKGGDIELSIEKTDGFYEGVVVIRYKDSQNVEAKIKSDLEEI